MEWRNGKLQRHGQLDLRLVLLGDLPNNGNLGLTFDASIYSGFADSVLLDITGVVVNSTAIGGSGPATTSTLNVNGKSLTLGRSSVTSGNVLTVSSGGTLNVGSGSASWNLKNDAATTSPAASTFTWSAVHKAKRKTSLPLSGNDN